MRIHWPIFDVLVEGHSSIDMEQLHISTLEEAEKFLLHYGFDLSCKEDKRKLEEIYIEAMNFISEQLIPVEWEKGLKPPQEILDAFDPCRLVLLASNSLKENTYNQKWACSILRVMHTIAHIDDVQRMQILEAAKEQILTPFQKHCFRNAENKLCFGNSQNHIMIHKIEWKTSKSRNSAILKLLHKPANVSETIYDLIGIRIVCLYLSDVIILIQLLSDLGLLCFPNANPTRSRNSLLDLDAFRQEMLKIKESWSMDLMRKIGFMPSVTSVHHKSNPHSSDLYQSIQMTCRQRVRFKNHLLEWREKMAQISHLSLDAFLKHFDQYAIAENLESSVFFPFEIQILDQTSAKKIEKGGSASHAKYKKSQLKTARKRILGHLL